MISNCWLPLQIYWVLVSSEHHRNHTASVCWPFCFEDQRRGLWHREQKIETALLWMCVGDVHVCLKHNSVYSLLYYWENKYVIYIINNNVVKIIIYSELHSLIQVNVEHEGNCLCVRLCNINSLQVYCLNINSIWHCLLNCRPEIVLACSVPHLAVCIWPSFLFGSQRISGLVPDTWGASISQSAVSLNIMVLSDKQIFSIVCIAMLHCMLHITMGYSLEPVPFVSYIDFLIIW